jgi:hypothetical protein
VEFRTGRSTKSLQLGTKKLKSGLSHRRIRNLDINTTPFDWTRAIGLFIAQLRTASRHLAQSPRSQGLIKVIFVGSAAMHGSERILKHDEDKRFRIDTSELLLR